MTNVVPLVRSKRFCVECKYYYDMKKGSLFAIPLPEVCTNPANGKDDPVSGHMNIMLPYGREPGAPCGVSGKFWEPKPPSFFRRMFGLG